MPISGPDFKISYTLFFWINFTYIHLFFSFILKNKKQVLQNHNWIHNNNKKKYIIKIIYTLKYRINAYTYYIHAADSLKVKNTVGFRWFRTRNRWFRLVLGRFGWFRLVSEWFRLVSGWFRLVSGGLGSFRVGSGGFGSFRVLVCTVLLLV